MCIWNVVPLTLLTILCRMSIELGRWEQICLVSAQPRSWRAGDPRWSGCPATGAGNDDPSLPLSITALLRWTAVDVGSQLSYGAISLWRASRMRRLFLARLFPCGLNDSTPMIMLVPSAIGQFVV